MSDTPETLAAILAEMRDERIIRLDGADVTRCLLLNLADRIEAAAERERDEDRQLAAIAESDESFARCARCDRPERAPGNAAAMREALEKIRREYCDGLISCRTCVSSEADVERVSDIFQKQIDAALSAPARNCDVGTAHEQYVRFEKHCNRKWKDYTNTDMRRPFPCGRNDTTNNPCARCFATWAQMPFAPAEGGKE